MGRTVSKEKSKSGEKLTVRLLNGVEKVGNKLPDPVTIFVLLCILIIALSAIISNTGVSVIHPSTEENLKVISLLERTQLQEFLSSVVVNFQGFAPLGVVLVTMLGAGVAEKSGFMEVLMKKMVSKVPKSMITLTIVFTGMLTSAFADIGFVILPPLAAIVFLGIGRHPLIGMFAGFASVAGGFSANIIVSILDVLLMGFTEPSAQMVDPNYVGNPAVNLYFMIVSTVVLTVIGTFVTEKYVAPRFKDYKGGSNNHDKIGVGEMESKALKYSLISLVVVLVAIGSLCIGDNAFMKDPETKSLLSSNAPFMKGLVPIILVAFLTPGLTFGFFTKKIKNDKDIVSYMGASMSDMGSYIVLSFVAAQFLYLFNSSNIGTVISIKGAEFLSNAGMTGKGLIIGFVILSALLNLLMGSASAKWAIMAPVFVPMFILLGYDPALTQMAYRIGDSITNPINPLLPYFPMIITFAKRYDKNIGMGTIIASMMPYTIAFSIVWVLLLLVFMTLGLPLGPGGGIYYSM